jgi:Spy/CpxP family protein refolding chaperone
MKRLCVLVGVIALVVFVGGAQVADGPKKPKGRLPANWAKLGLTAEQKDQVYKIQSDFRNRIAPLEQKLKELRQEELREMEKVLTEPQKARLQEILKAKKPAPPDKKEEKKPTPDDKKPKPDTKK